MTLTPSRLFVGVAAFAGILVLGLALAPALDDASRTDAGVARFGVEAQSADPDAPVTSAGKLVTDSDGSPDSPAASSSDPAPSISSAGGTQVEPPTTGASSEAPPQTTASTSSNPPPPSSAATVDPSAPQPVTKPGDYDAPMLQIRIAIESKVDDVDQDFLAEFVIRTLSAGDSWPRAGFSFVEDANSELRVILAEGPEVDRLCAPLRTRSQVSCQNGAVVAMNATRWRDATDSWDGTVELYRTYLVNHEVGHLIGQRHPTPRCPVPGAPAAIMEQQTKGLEGCTGNGTPRSWEIDYARRRPAVIGPLPSWGPDPVPANLEGR